MDNMTASMCFGGTGNLDYARVFVEMVADKEIKNEVEVQYRDQEKNVKGTKKINVLYDWKPLRCSHCKVFGHDMEHCLENKNKQGIWV